MALLRILIVEDHPLMADALRTHLQSLVPQVQCVQAGNLHDGLTCLEAQAFDLVLLDLNLPDSQGIQSLNAFCMQRTHGPMAVLSAVDEEDIAQVCLENNVVYLRKSVQASQLMAELLALITMAVSEMDISPVHLSKKTSPQHLFLALSKKQRLVLAQLSTGKTTPLIAQELKLSEATVRSHMQSIYKKIGVRNRTQACAVYLRWMQQHGHSLP